MIFCLVRNTLKHKHLPEGECEWAKKRPLSSTSKDCVAEGSPVGGPGLKLLEDSLVGRRVCQPSGTLRLLWHSGHLSGLESEREVVETLFFDCTVLSRSSLGMERRQGRLICVPV